MLKNKSAPDSGSNQLITITALDGEFLSKLVDKDCNKVSSYDKCFKLNLDLVEYSNFHEALKEIFELKETAFLLGGATVFLKAELEVGHRLQRRLSRETSGTPTVEYRDGCEFSLDLDDVEMPGFDPFNPVPAIKAWLKTKEIKSDVTWQITAGQKPESTDFPRVRLYIQLDKGYPSKDRKSHSIVLGADPSVYTATQPNYTAPPRFPDGVKDPILIRTGFIEGKNRTHKLENIPEEILNKYSPILGSRKSGEQIDLTKAQTLLDEGKMFRRVMLPVSFSMCNQKDADPDSVLAALVKMAYSIPEDKRRNNEWDGAKLKDGVMQNLREMIDDGFSKIAAEEKKRKVNSSTEIYSFSCEELIDMDIPPIHWIVEGFLPAGSALLFGKPKKGKSWIALLIATCVATGKPVFSRKSNKGKVLYLGLEDNERRLQSRAKTCLRKLDVTTEDICGNLHFAIQCARLAEGLEIQIRNWMKKHPDTKLIVLDMLKNITPLTKKTGIYEIDSEKGSLITNVAREYPDLCILTVHHSKKELQDDAFDSSSGSTGLTGSFDSLYAIVEIKKGRFITCAGKDIEVSDSIPLSMDDNGFYTLEVVKTRSVLAGAAENYVKIAEAIKAGHVKPKTIAKFLTMNESTVKTTLTRGVKEEYFEKKIRGEYSLVENVEFDEFDEEISKIQ